MDLQSTLVDDDDDAIVGVLANDDDELVTILAIYQRKRRQRLRPRRGSVFGRAKTRDRDIQLGHYSIMRDYLGPSAVYDEPLFQRRYRLPTSLFRRLLREVSSANPYFQQKPDAVGKMGASPEKKLTAALRMLGGGTSADAQDEYCRLAEATVMDSLHEFCKTVVEVYGEVYLRSPTATDVAKILRFNENRGMPGLLGSLDCTHWRWKNCPTAWHGQYQGKEGAPTVVLEAVATADRWIWHSFFGIPGSNNDINMLDRSPLLHSFLNNTGPRVSYKIGEEHYDTPYYFVDGIYPSWSTFISAFVEPIDRTKMAFTKAHEAIRKDVECAFGILKSRFAVLAVPSRLWYKVRMKYVIYCCILLHNMIIELREEGVPDYLPDPYETDGVAEHTEERDRDVFLDDATSAIDELGSGSTMEMCKRLKTLQDENASKAFREVLCRHYWNWNATH